MLYLLRRNSPNFAVLFPPLTVQVSWFEQKAVAVLLGFHLLSPFLTSPSFCQPSSSSTTPSLPSFPSHSFSVHCSFSLIPRFSPPVSHPPPLAHFLSSAFLSSTSSFPIVSLSTFPSPPPLSPLSLPHLLLLPQPSSSSTSRTSGSVLARPRLSHPTCCRLAVQERF